MDETMHVLVKHVTLDALADRLGEVYQWVGRLQHDHAIQDDRVTTIMDELVQLCEDVERISGRTARECGPPSSS